MKVSIVTPTYNSAQYIVDTYNSIRAQTYSDWEWLVVDDQSTDATYEIIQGLVNNDSRIRAFKNTQNLGAGLSRNVAIENSDGRFIAFLDSDDLWLPTKLAEQIDFMVKNNYAFTYTQYQKFNYIGELGVVMSRASVTYEQLLFSNVIGCLTVIYDTDIVGKVFMPSIRKRQDMATWLTILKMVPRAYCLGKVLAMYRIDSGMTSDKTKVLQSQWVFYRNYLGFSFVKACIYFCAYFVMGVAKTIK
jgi:glycosyltransferase involved in cell wall biosynthesis